ncbi:MULTISPECIES: TetR/AcrR family transcriptional regulator [Rhodobacterales]|jgi:AcrR family transcriptional regulator|uniref:TetR/AcrR family transcriptional regulator n=1 Tax=Rhodobacterales TaxID=204455 RepID=UPI00237F71BA|nr:TetR/AcrR family transcriptional regulator [Phaeobacter gallaeciensis]MDE4141118.1 TetR/AcrR family transcriptional regulator [Phaeobacter gallaeciensis]MDE4149563.1 TetR/AcrR family transcriptional regulator [Phaeobacter gallaeciensis]MDE4153987.1 TetR/AcrR family transcriptional regulator [Phaeobacter gallaeciensis]MDE4229379.1 TetR/AcrR family transcriptional regulator [Phaeobacter gallaeciensis]MDE4258253.1 TetR/AcrR family transcriptional regulator [Phaeobacter gallaeciensis]
MPPKPILHRDDPTAEPLTGNVKVTRADWLNVAMDVLISHGVEQVKVLALAERMGVSRSSFYWYFKSRQDLLDALLQTWEQTNTAAMVAQTEAPAAAITGAVLNVFHCIANPDLFNTALDFAVRDWARRSGKVRSLLDRSDARRVKALSDMFSRYGYPELEAKTRAKVLYYMQLGYDMAEPNESHKERLQMTPHYLRVFTGKEPLPEELEEFAIYTERYWDV